MCLLGVSKQHGPTRTIHIRLITISSPDRERPLFVMAVNARFLILSGAQCSEVAFSF